MPRGEHTVQNPEKDDHMKNFDKAIADALRKWNPDDGEKLSVQLEAHISPNPGGIKTYVAIVGG
jgi:hypothetical protein